MREGFLKVGALVPKIKLCNPIYNAEEIIKGIKDAYDYGVEVLATPELCITGASCGDLFYQDILIEKTNEAIARVCEATNDIDITIILGTPARIDSKLYSCAVIIHKGKIIGFVPKNNLNKQEARWFEQGKNLYSRRVNFFGSDVTFDRNVFEVPNHKGAFFDVELSVKELVYLNPDNRTVYASFNLSSDYDVVSKTTKIKKEAVSLSKENGIGYIYLMPGINESSSDYVYSGYSLIIDDGDIIREGEKFSFESSLIHGDIKLNEESNDYIMTKDYPSDKRAQKELCKYPFVPVTKEDINERCKEVLEMQASALASKLKHIDIDKVVLGVSGGSDSTLALIVCSKAFEKLGIDSKNIIAVSMPGFGTTERTYNNGKKLSESYNTTFREISIKDACLQHFKDIGLPSDDRSVAYENTQARERTQILMDIANMEHATVIGTGDMSELALGWCTYNGDHMSMYAVNANVPKTLIKHIIRYEAEETNNEVLLDIIDTPISPELLPPDEKGDMTQKTELSVGPYALHDYFLYHFMKYHPTPDYLLKIATEAFKEEYSEQEVSKWLNVFLRRFFSQQFKRNCMPEGPKVGSIGLCSRGDLVIPSDADSSCWLLID
jgi:NAD+ synthase (glutamine-hydrolysing)